MRYALGLMLALLALDALIKLGQPGQWHQPSGSTMGLMLLPCALAMAWPFTRFAAAVCTAGVLGNTLWQLNPAGVPNPFVTGGSAYNLADVFIVVGGYSTALLIIMSPILVFNRATR